MKDVLDEINPRLKRQTINRIRMAYKKSHGKILSPSEAEKLYRAILVDDESEKVLGVLKDEMVSKNP
jgi:hypothetical protein